MNFFRKKNSIQVSDYIDEPLIEALPIHHQKLVRKLISSESSHIDKFFNKLSSNEIYLNHDMLQRILDKLMLQMSLPLQILHEDPNHNLLENFKFEESVHSNQWLNMLKKLNIWSDTNAKSIFPYLSLAHNFIEQGQFPNYTLQKSPPSKHFWQKKEIGQLSTEILFQFIFDKLKYFHWDLLPHRKRPMDLFELFCPIEDAALENRLIVLNDQQTDFFRSLNASALIFSAVHSFPYALPDLVSEDLDAHHEPIKQFFHFFIQCPNYQPLFGVHPHLKELNLHGLYLGLSNFFKEIILSDYSTSNHIQLVYDYLHKQNCAEQIQYYFQNVTNRLIFIFNRLTTLGYLLRSPLLKGLGYHPFMNSDVPNRLSVNTELFLNHFLSLNETQKFNLLEKFMVESYSSQNTLQYSFNR